MTIKKEPIHAGEFLLSEGAGNISRETSTSPPAPHWAGQILGRVTASGEFVPYSPDAEDGSETAVAVSSVRWVNLMLFAVAVP